MAGGVRARHAGPSGANGTSRRRCGRNRRRGWSRSASNGYPSVERAPGLLGRGPPHRRPTARRCDPRRLFRPNSTARVARESPDKRPDLGGPAYFRAASPAKRGRGTRRPDVGRLCPTARPSAVTSVSDRAATRKHGCLKQVQIGRYGRTHPEIIAATRHGHQALHALVTGRQLLPVERLEYRRSTCAGSRILQEGASAARSTRSSSTARDRISPRKGLPNGGESCASPRIMPMKHKNNGRTQSNKQS